MSNRGATGAGINKSRALVNSSYSSRNNSAQGAGGNKGNENKHASISSKNVVRRMPPPATLPSLKAEHGQDPSIVIVPQGGIGWNAKSTTPTIGAPEGNSGQSTLETIAKNVSSDSRTSTFGGANAASACHDLRPTWAKSASGHISQSAASCPTPQFSTPAESAPRAVNTATASLERAVHQQKSSSERDFPTLETAANARFQEEKKSSDSDASPPIPLIRQPQAACYIGASVPKQCVSRKLPDRYCGGGQSAVSNSSQKYNVLQRIAKLSLEKEQTKKASSQPQSKTDSFEVVDNGFSNHQDVKEDCTIQKESEIPPPVGLQTTERCPSVAAQPQDIYQNSQQQSMTSVSCHYQATESDLTIGDFQQAQNYLLPSTNAPPPIQQNQQTFQLSHNQHQPLLFNQPPPQQTQSQQLEAPYVNVHHQISSIPNVTLPLHFNQPPPQIQSQTMITNFHQPIEQGNVSHFENLPQRDVMSVGVWGENPPIARNDDQSHFIQHHQSPQKNFKTSGRLNEAFRGMSDELETQQFGHCSERSKQKASKKSTYINSETTSSKSRQALTPACNIWVNQDKNPECKSVHDSEEVVSPHQNIDTVVKQHDSASTNSKRNKKVDDRQIREYRNRKKTFYGSGKQKQKIAKTSNSTSSTHSETSQKYNVLQRFANLSLEKEQAELSPSHLQLQTDDCYSNHQEIKENSTLIRTDDVFSGLQPELNLSTSVQPQGIYQSSQQYSISQQSMTPVAPHYLTQAELSIGDFQPQHYSLPSTNAPPPILQQKQHIQQMQQTFQLSSQNQLPVSIGQGQQFYQQPKVLTKIDHQHIYQLPQPHQQVEPPYMNVHHQVPTIPNVTIPLNFNQPPPQIQTHTLFPNYQQQQQQRLPIGQGNVSHFEQHTQRDVVSVGVWGENPPPIARNDEHNYFVQRQQQSSQQSCESSVRINDTFGGISGELETHQFGRWFQPPTSQPSYQYNSGGQQSTNVFRGNDYPPSLLSLDISSYFKRSSDYEQDVSGFRHLNAKNQQYNSSHNQHSDAQRNDFDQHLSAIPNCGIDNSTFAVQNQDKQVERPRVQLFKHNSESVHDSDEVVSPFQKYFDPVETTVKQHDRTTSHTKRNKKVDDRQIREYLNRKKTSGKPKQKSTKASNSTSSTHSEASTSRQAPFQQISAPPAFNIWANLF